ncbi:hypothetical protein AB0E64_37520 [Streptomyces caelestis]|uniref:Uncharacterized protein n=1 Tax=Streptomyces caelestis TaxID=36816 RepID=A0A7W9GZ19_9ACTN|nr:hypothetical protein [Streptomyces caelestis]MBB5792637.1 hypothetical protein [Streptomyces caelestis]GGW69898.1 hypothetical protein GCM10010320_59020 [Streptomyces caelestis]
MSHTALLVIAVAGVAALLIDVALCGYFLGARGWDRARIAEVMGSALPPVAMVILGAGGVFGKVLVASSATRSPTSWNAPACPCCCRPFSQPVIGWLTGAAVITAGQGGGPAPTRPERPGG